MPESTIASRVRRVVEDGNESDAYWYYVQALHENWRRLEDNMRRTLLLLGLVAVTFELAIRAVIEDVSFVGISLADLSLPVVFTPAVFAFLTYELLSGVALMTEIARIHDAFMKEAHSSLYEQDLHLQIGPHNVPLLADLRWRLRGRHRSRAERYLKQFTVFRVTLVVGAVFVFEFYALYRVAFSLPQSLDAPTSARIIASLLSVALFVPCILYATDFASALRTRLRTGDI